jgi:hypothetical protein
MEFTLKLRIHHLENTTVQYISIIWTNEDELRIRITPRTVSGPAGHLCMQDICECDLE